MVSLTPLILILIMAQIVLLPSPAFCEDLKLENTKNDFQLMELPLIVTEPGEVQTFEIENYIRANLLQLSITPMSSGSKFKEWQKFIGLPDQMVSKWTEFITEAPDGGTEEHKPKAYHKDPFPRSSVFLQGINSTLAVYFIDRNFNFHKFDVSQYQSGKINHVYSQPLDSKLVNFTCRDLHVVYNRDIDSTRDQMLMLCEGLVSSIMQKEKVIELQKKEYVVKLDLSEPKSVGLEYLEVQDSLVSMDRGYKFFNWTKTNETDDTMQLLTTTNNHRYLVLINLVDSKDAQGNPFIKHEFADYVQFNIGSIRHQDLYCDIQDLVIIDHKRGIIAAVDSNYGLFITQYQFQNCDCTNGSIVGPIQSLLKYKGLEVLHYNRQEPDTMFVGVMHPSVILEIDISDLLNPFIRKTYYLHQDSQKYIGVKYMTSNHKYLVQSLLRMDNLNQVLRFYRRDASQDYFAQFEVIINEDSFKSTFYTFPNFDLNLMLFRDELTFNLTQIVPMRLEIDRQEETTYENKDPFQLMIYGADYLGTRFEIKMNIIFLQRNDSSLFSGNLVNIPEYSCGDYKYNIPFQNNIQGPNFQMDLTQRGAIDTKDQVEYFQIKKKNASKRFHSSYKPQQCDEILMDAYSIDQRSTFSFLICVKRENARISMNQMILTQNDDSEISEGGFGSIELVLKIPDSTIVFIQYDDLVDLLVVVTEEENLIKNDFPLFLSVHFVEITDILVWKKVVKKYDMDIENFDFTSYNSAVHKGIIVYCQNYTGQFIITRFKVDTENYDFFIEASQAFPQKDYADNVIKSEMSNSGLIWVLYSNNTIIVYESPRNYHSMSEHSEGITIVQANNFVKRKSREVPYLNRNFENPSSSLEVSLIDFDIVNDKYLVVYFNNTETFVYRIENKYYLRFKMQLPKYGNMTSYEFAMNKKLKSMGISSPKRAKDNSYLALVVEASIDSIAGGNQSLTQQIWLYDVSQNKHSSYIFNITNNWLCQGKYESLLQFTTLDQKFLLTLVSMNSLEVWDLTTKEHLVVNQKHEQKLISKCKNLKQAQPISIIDVCPQSQLADHEFGYNTGCSIKESRILSSNQGLAIHPLQNQVNIGISLNSQDLLRGQHLILREALAGQNMNFHFECEVDGYDCMKFISIKDAFQGNSHYIEFITSTQQVMSSFLLGDYIFILDTYVKLNTLKLQSYKNQRHDSINEFSEVNSYEIDDDLVHLETLCQLRTFGCFLDGFVQTYDLRDTSVFEKKASHKKMIIYQCSIEGVQVIKFATITIFNGTENPERREVIYLDTYTTQLDLGAELIEIQQIANEQIVTPLKISDIQLVTAREVDQTFSPSIYGYEDFYMVVALDNPKSFTNYLKIYSLHYYDKMGSANLTNTYSSLNHSCIRVFDSYNNSVDTFKVKHLFFSQSKKLLFFTLDWYGFGIIDMVTKDYVHYYNFHKYTQASKQSSDVIFSYSKQLEIVGITSYGHNYWHLITNHGTFRLLCNVNLETKDPFAKVSPSLFELIDVQLIQNNFGRKITEIVESQIGYVYLYYNYLNGQVHDAHLQFVSYSQERSSRVISKMWLAYNTPCNSLQLASEQPKTGVAVSSMHVSVICGTVMYTVQFILYPHITIEASSAVDSIRSASIAAMQGKDQYNQYTLNINLTASNTRSNQTIPVVLQVVNNTVQGYQSLQILIILLFAWLLFAFIFIFNKYTNMQQIKKNIAKNKRSRTMTDASRDRTTSYTKQRQRQDPYMTEVHGITLRADRFSDQDVLSPMMARTELQQDQRMSALSGRDSFIFVSEYPVSQHFSINRDLKED